MTLTWIGMRRHVHRERPRLSRMRGTNSFVVGTDLSVANISVPCEHTLQSQNVESMLV